MCHINFLRVDIDHLKCPHSQKEVNEKTYIGYQTLVLLFFLSLTIFILYLHWRDEVNLHIAFYKYDDFDHLFSPSLSYLVPSNVNY